MIVNSQKATSFQQSQIDDAKKGLDRSMSKAVAKVASKFKMSLNLLDQLSIGKNAHRK